MTPQPAGLSPRSVVSEAVRERLGERFGPSRHADSGHLELFVVEPTATDRAFVEAVAREAGIEGSVRVLTFESEWVTAWRELSPELERLYERRVLSGSTSPGPTLQLPPWTVSLHAYAIDEAVALHEHFGSLVELRVGFLAYPPNGVDLRLRTQRSAEPTVEDGTGLLSVALDRPAVIVSGHTVRQQLLVTNLGSTDIAAFTGPNLIAEIVDPSSGVVVGGYSGGQRSSGHFHTIPPGKTKPIPLLIGTASLVPDLGYALPPGEWSLRIVLPLRDASRQTLRTARHLLLPPLPVTITD